ncbi:hypothetical protein KUCAC02_013821 [Chaenocephalus aceratus]|uniref:Uncharacterized protein n=1 Tax=Chaenocephalus aceratus TaxID=36190 RepID=A0ACB9WBZ3_CHAAC|nr:hypothetical protein KUCAC02_013821 [Chaenocephalus aceratus]
MKAKASIPPLENGLHLFWNTSRRNYSTQKVQDCRVFPVRLALDPASCLQREAGAPRPGFTLQRAAAQRPVVNHQRRKSNGASARAVWKKDESGSLPLSTACGHCSEPQGRGGAGRRQPSPSAFGGCKKPRWESTVLSSQQLQSAASFRRDWESNAAQSQ